MARISFLGLGVMGAPMAGHLATVGHSVTVYNRTPAKALAWVALHGNQALPTPAEAAENAEFVITCVGNDDDVRSVVLGGSGVLAAMQQGSVLIDHTTTSADMARELNDACAAAGIDFVDAPVSGGQAGAENGALTIMCGADDPAVFDRVSNIVAPYARDCRLLGAAGAGQTTKMVNQICIAGILQGLSEGVAFAQAAGLDVDEVVAAISQGAAGSWQMENRAVNMASEKFDYGFAVEWMRKDLGFCLAEGERLGVEMPVTALVDQLYKRVIARGGARWDTSSLVHLLQHP